jgi:hypothetical protein
MERPVDPEVVRAVLATAVAVTIGLACLVGLSAGGPGRSAPDRRGATPPPIARPASSPTPAAGPSPHPRQDPQDRSGTTAHRRVAHELATHRALQHVPWHHGGVTIKLVGAKDGKAILSVLGPGRPADRRARHIFLRRFHDDGRSYLFRLRVARGGRR